MGTSHRTCIRLERSTLIGETGTRECSTEKNDCLRSYVNIAVNVSLLCIRWKNVLSVGAIFEVRTTGALSCVLFSGRGCLIKSALPAPTSSESWKEKLSAETYRFRILERLISAYFLDSYYDQFWFSSQ